MVTNTQHSTGSAWLLGRHFLLQRQTMFKKEPNSKPCLT